MRSRLTITAALLAAVLPLGVVTGAGASAAKGFAKCAPGKVLAHHKYKTSAGPFLVEATMKSDFDFFVCTVSPKLKTTKQNGVNVAQFNDGLTFKQDSLGHVFYNLQPGQISGVGVVIFDAKNAIQRGIYVDATVIQHRHRPFAILQRHNDCDPDCASGHITKQKLQWNPKHQDYR
jgi:hypothetical protein